MSNPPYVLPEEIETLEPEVREWEPRQALVGVGATEAVARGALDVLRPGGALVLGGRSRRCGPRRVTSPGARLHGHLGYAGPGREGQGCRGRDHVSPQCRMSSVDRTVAAIESGELVVIPIDTVYGLACRPDREEAVRALSALKGRSADQPIALVAAGVDALLELIPELPPSRLRRGPFTLVLANPGPAVPVAERSASRHDRRPHSRTERRRRRAPGAGRRGRSDERQPPRRPGSAASRRGAGRDHRKGRCRAGRRRAARYSVDRHRSDRSGTSGSP